MADERAGEQAIKMSAGKCARSGTRGRSQRCEYNWNTVTGPGLAGCLEGKPRNPPGVNRRVWILRRSRVAGKADTFRTWVWHRIAGPISVPRQKMG